MNREQETRRPLRPRIGELLWRRGACDRDTLRRAWELKVIYGDRLGTNLLAESLISEKELALALGEQHGVHAAYGELLRVDPRAVRLIPAPFADRHDVVPHHVQDDTLYLLMADPHDVEVKDLVAKGTGLKVAPVVVCEARMWALLLEHYGISRGLRPIALDGDPFVVAKRRAAAHEQQKAQTALGPELTSEEDFEALYMSRAFGEEPPGEEPALEPQLEPALDEQAPIALGQPLADATAPGALLEDVTPIVAGRPLSSAELEPVGEAPLVEIPLEQPAPLPLPKRPEVARPTAPSMESPTPGSLWAAAVQAEAEAPAQPVVAQPVVAQPVVAEAGTVEPPVVAETGTVEQPVVAEPVVGREGLGAGPIVVAEPAAAQPVVEQLSPLSFDEAVARLQGVNDRDEIARVVLRYALTRFRRAALLTVHPHGVFGWEALGDLPRAAVRRFRLARSDRSAFGIVVDNRAHYIGPLQTWTANGAWLKATGRQLPRSVAIFPILVRGRVVNLLYGDNGHGAHVESDVGELLILAQRIADSYEALLKEPVAFSP